MAALTQLFVVIAESHKTLQAKLCDILFPCGDQATKNREPVLGGGGGCKDLSCQKNVWEREGSSSTSKTEVTARTYCKKQFEKKKNFALKALKFSDCRDRIRRQIQPSYKKS